MQSIQLNLGGTASVKISQVPFDAYPKGVLLELSVNDAISIMQFLTHAQAQLISCGLSMIAKEVQENTK